MKKKAKETDERNITSANKKLSDLQIITPDIIRRVFTQNEIEILYKNFNPENSTVEALCDEIRKYKQNSSIQISFQSPQKNKQGTFLPAFQNKQTVFVPSQMQQMSPNFQASQIQQNFQQIPKMNIHQQQMNPNHPIQTMNSNIQMNPSISQIQQVSPNMQMPQMKPGLQQQQINHGIQMQQQVQYPKQLPGYPQQIGFSQMGAQPFIQVQQIPISPLKPASVLPNGQLPQTMIPHKQMQQVTLLPSPMQMSIPQQNPAQPVQVVTSIPVSQQAPNQKLQIKDNESALLTRSLSTQTKEIETKTAFSNTDPAFLPPPQKTNNARNGEINETVPIIIPNLSHPVHSIPPIKQTAPLPLEPIYIPDLEADAPDRKEEFAEKEQQTENLDIQLSEQSTQTYSQGPQIRVEAPDSEEPPPIFEPDDAVVEQTPPAQESSTTATTTTTSSSDALDEQPKPTQSNFQIELMHQAELIAQRLQKMSNRIVSLQKKVFTISDRLDILECV